MANKISVLIDVTVDKANTALRNFQTSIADADGAVGKFKAGAASAGDSLKANIMPIAAAAGLAVAAFASKAVAAASDLEESSNAVGVAFGSAAEDVLALGENAAESYGVSQRAFNEAAVGFSSFAADIAGENGNVAEVLNDLMTRATDMASVFNVEVPDAAAAMKSALSGEAEPMKRFGIVMSEAKVKAYALANGIIQTGESMDDAQKQAARYGFIMEETSKVQGDWTNTSDGLAGSQKKLSAMTEDLSAKFGTLLLPVIADAANVIVDLTSALEDADSATGGVGGKILSLGNVFSTTRGLWDKSIGQWIAWTSESGRAGESADDTSDKVYGLAQSMVDAEIKTALAEQVIKDNADATSDLAKQYSVMEDGVRSANEALAEYIETTLDSVSSSLSAEQATIELAQAMQDQAESTTEANDVLADSTATDAEKATALRELRLEQIANAEKALEMAEAYAEESGAAEGSAESAQLQIDALSMLKGQYPEMADDLQVFIDGLLAVPGTVDTASDALGYGVSEGIAGGVKRGGILVGDAVTKVMSDALASAAQFTKTKG